MVVAPTAPAPHRTSRRPPPVYVISHAKATARRLLSQRTTTKGLTSMMNKILVMMALCFGFLSAGAPREAAAQTAQVRVVGASLLEFERAVSWASVSPAWRVARPAWLLRVRAAATPRELAAATVALETAMGWPGVQDSWRQERAGWVQAMAAATTEAEVARGLVRLEAVTKWEAMSRAWRVRRTPWLARLVVVAAS